MLAKIIGELRHHAPFTAIGTLSGVIIMLFFTNVRGPHSFSNTLFWTLHPIHVLLSALVTAGLYRRRTRGSLRATFIIGYVGAVGIATLSDSLIPFFGEWLLAMPYRGIHIGFVEKWYLVNPLVLFGIIIGYFWPRTYIPHAGHVFLSTWASLFHMIMAFGDSVPVLHLAVIPVFLFLAVWLPCCTSDIVFPMLFAKNDSSKRADK